MVFKGDLEYRTRLHLSYLFIGAIHRYINAFLQYNQKQISKSRPDYGKSDHLEIIKPGIISMFQVTTQRCMLINKIQTGEFVELYMFISTTIFKLYISKKIFVCIVCMHIQIHFKLN